jgi:hypothetical protein
MTMFLIPKENEITQEQNACTLEELFKQAKPLAARADVMHNTSQTWSTGLTTATRAPCSYWLW